MSDLRSHPRAASPSRVLLVLLLLALPLGACGGGGGGGVVIEVPPEVEPSGLRGVVTVPGVELGRIAEQEPNDSPQQPNFVAPLFPRAALEIAGHVGADPADLGRADPLDILRILSIVDQDVSVEITYREIEAVNDSLTLSVVDLPSGATVATAAGPGQPLTTSFTASAGVPYDLGVGIGTGAAAYVVRLVLTDPIGSPKPQSLKVQPLNNSGLHEMQASSAEPSAAPMPVATLVAPGDPACACTHLLVRLEDGVDAEALCAAHGLRIQRRLTTGTLCLAFEHATASEGRHKAVELAAMLADCEGVAFAEPDWIVRPLAIPDDTKYGCQWNLRAIGCEPAWDITTGNPNVVIGVVDTGVVPDHPDLFERLVPGYDFVSTEAVGGDGDGIDTDPTDVGDRGLPSGLSTWHGTHVAGICVGRQNDGYGITGVAPGCRVMPLRALGIGGGFVSDLAAALDFGAALTSMPGRGQLPQPLDIMNLSVGLAVDSTELRLACERAANRGVLLIAASGNTGQAVLYPAAYPSVMAIGAVDTDLNSTAYSSFGLEVELAAPGGLIQGDGFARGWPDHIFSCVKDDTIFPRPMHHAGLQGTSQAAPHVAAAAALLLSIDPTLSSAALKSYLTASALDVGAEGSDVAHGSGLLQVHTAMKLLLADQGTPRNDPPILVLPTKSLRFTGFDTLRTLPISNGGGGLLTVTAAQTATDDGGFWLSAALVPATTSPDSNVKELEVSVDRGGLANGRYSGTIRLANPDGVLCAMRIIMYVGELPRAGRPVHIVALDGESGIARKTTAIYPEYSWRFWLTGLAEGNYLLKAGEDLDEDTFFCEPADYCGWWGGAVEPDASPVGVQSDGPAVTGLLIELFPPR